MKKIFFIVSILLINVFAFLKSFSQTDVNAYWNRDIWGNNDNFYQIRDEANAYFHNHPELDTIKGTGRKDFMRWETFWSNRIFKVNCKKPGSFSYANDALMDFLNTKSQYLPDQLQNNSNWTPLGPDYMPTQNLGIIGCIKVDPNDNTLNTIYVGTNASGLWKTVDGGLHWSNITDNIGMPGLGVQDVVIDPANSNKIYIATGVTTYGKNGYGIGVCKTIDGGNTWSSTSLVATPNEYKTAYKLLIDPTNTNRQYALVNDKVYRTEDAWVTNSLIFDLLTNPSPYRRKLLRDIEMKPNDNNTLYIASDGFATYTSEVWSTSNATSQGQVIWERQDQKWGSPIVERYELAVSQSQEADVYLTYRDSVNIKILKSGNSGLTWNSVYTHKCGNSYGGDFGGTGYWRLQLVVSPTNPDILYIGGFEIDKVDLSTGRNEHFTYNTPLHNNYYHVDTRALFYAHDSINNVNVLFSGNDGGVSQKRDGSSFKNINGHGLNISQFYGMGNSEINESFIIGGTQDNGIVKRFDNKWDNYVTGDAYRVLIDYQNPLVMYATSNGGSKFATSTGGSNYIRKTTDGGNTWKYITTPPGVTRCDRPFLMHPTDANTIYVAHHDVFKTINGGQTWQNISNFNSLPDPPPQGVKLAALAISSSDPNIIFTAFEEPTWSEIRKYKLYKTTDGGNSWQDITNATGLNNVIRWIPISDIVISDYNPNKIWISFGGFWDANTNRILLSDDGGSSWTDYSSGLPNLPVNCIKYYKGSNLDEIFIGNDVGVFYRSNQLNQWIGYSNNLPVSIVSDIEINYKSETIRAATFGRGIWESPLPCKNDNIFSEASESKGTQSPTWAPLGAVWYYHVVNIMGSEITYARFEVTGDTVIQGKNCSIISGGEQGWYFLPGDLSEAFTYEENGKVYVWDPLTSLFCLVYDFSLPAGQSYQSSWNNCLLDHTITSIDTINVNGFNLATYKLGELGWIDCIQYIGNSINLFPDIYNSCDTLFYDGLLLAGLRCYDDTIIGHYETGIVPYCDYITGIRDNKKDEIVIISPNPGANSLHIQTTLKDAKLEMYNATGRLVIQQNIRGTTIINTSAINTGMYFYRVIQNGMLKKSGKWVKE